MLLKKSLLRKYQWRAVKEIVNNVKKALFLDMGMGKTVSVLTAIEHLQFYEMCITRALVIAPKRVAESVWAQEAAKWEHTRGLIISRIVGTEPQRLKAMRVKADVYVLGRDNLKWYFSQNDRPDTNFLAIDESSSFKNQDSQRFKELKKNVHEFKWVVIMTGTPTPNSLIELWPQIFLLDQGRRLGRVFGKFRTEFFYKDPYNPYKWLLFPGAERKIFRRIKDIALSMKSDDYLDLPKVTFNTVNVDMDDRLVKEYKKFQRDLLLELGEADITAANAAVLSNKLQQFSNGAVYDEERTVHHIHDLKLDALEEILNETSDNLLIAYQFEHDRDRILERFKKYNPRVMKKDKDVVDWNDGKIRMMLLHPASGGHGLNLQYGGHTIVWFGVTWSLELFQQLNKRLPRPGQKFPVMIHIIVANGGIEARAMRSLENKEAGQNALLEYVSELRQSLRA